YDTEFVHIRLDFTDAEKFESFDNPKCVITMKGDETAVISLPLVKGYRQSDANMSSAVDEIGEVSIRRQAIVTNGAGTIALAVEVYEGNKHVESWPENDELTFAIPETTREMFWPF
ncbi:MAG: hypothetical protein AAB305_00405, partial [Candidatus Zixiibacteriota bacterium]